MDVTKYLLFGQLQQHIIGNDSAHIFLKSAIILGILSYEFFNKGYIPKLCKIYYHDYLLKIKNIFRKKYTYIIVGKCWNSFNQEFHTQRIVNSMSNQFLALLQYLTVECTMKHEFMCLMLLSTSQKNNDQCRFYHVRNEVSENDIQNKEQIIPDQPYPVCIDTDLGIYCVIEYEQIEEENNNNSRKSKCYIDTYIIKIKLFSYISSSFVIKEFVDNITSKYLDGLENSRRNKRFIYTMLSVRGNCDENDDDIQTNDIARNGIVWNEMQFNTVKSFDTLYLKNKSDILDKINFFQNNRDWYYSHGIPYTLGIGLHGPPGTGKTSFIKALAKHTNRHIVCISMKIVTTRNQLQTVFYETQYNKQNTYIGFQDKIIVFEDIDCTGKIVLERENAQDVENDSDNSVVSIDEQKQVTQLLKNALTPTPVLPDTTPTKDKALTLDDLLNMWDGLLETPGRIMVITSNFYHKLDKALIRRGRIDLEIETTLDDANDFHKENNIY